MWSIRQEAFSCRSAWICRYSMTWSWLINLGPDRGEGSQRAGESADEGEAAAALEDIARVMRRRVYRGRLALATRSG